MPERPRQTALLASVVLALSLAMSAPAAASEKLAVVLYNGIGTTAGAWFSGRTLQDKGLRLPKGRESTRSKLWRMVQALESDEIGGVALNLTVAGRRVQVTSDDEGMFDVQLAGPLPVGTHAIQATLRGAAKASKFKSFRALPAAVSVFPPGPATAVISDFDDTVAATNVTSKLRMVKQLLTTNARDMRAFPGAARLYHALRRKGWPIAFVSGSPVNLHTRIDRFLQLNGFPTAPLLLKRLGSGEKDDSLFAHETYKIKQIHRLMTLLPRYRFVLIGDSGERDPEVYRSIVKSHPDRVVSVRIHNVTKSAAANVRFAGQTLFSSYPALAQTLRKGSGGRP